MGKGNSIVPLVLYETLESDLSVDGYKNAIEDLLLFVHPLILFQVKQTNKQTKKTTVYQYT